MLQRALEPFRLNEAQYTPQLSLLNRFRQANEIVQATFWLASDLSSYVTVTTLHVVPGYTSR